MILLTWYDKKYELRSANNDVDFHSLAGVFLTMPPAMIWPREPFHLKILTLSASLGMQTSDVADVVSIPYTVMRAPLCLHSLGALKQHPTTPAQI